MTFAEWISTPKSGQCWRIGVERTSSLELFEALQYPEIANPPGNERGGRIRQAKSGTPESRKWSDDLPSSAHRGGGLIREKSVDNINVRPA